MIVLNFECSLLTYLYFQRAKFHHVVEDLVDLNTASILTTDKNANLWVDKYRPKCYMDLLSQEVILYLLTIEKEL